MNYTNLTSLTRGILLLCGLALLAVLFVPLWQIQLSAPQYPEGLVLKLYPHKIGGDVAIINGLNHYIGMKTLHPEDFPEFTILPYIIVFFSALCLAVGLFLKTYKWLLSLFVLFVVFGLVAMADFWRWEYQYGHDLDSNAPINVPGMSYQPPLIGYKQLLNFGAYSIPDTGGWIFIAVGISLVIAIIIQYRHQKKVVWRQSKMSVLLFFLFSLFISSCSTEPKPIIIGVDACSFCKMAFVDKRFGAELITHKGKVYKFDDLHCLAQFSKASAVKAADISQLYVVAYEAPHNFIKLEEALLLKSQAFKSPMGSHTAAFLTPAQFKAARQQFNGVPVHADSLLHLKSK